MTHDAQHAARACERTAFLATENEGEPGRPIEHGPGDQISRRPADPRTGADVSGRFG